MANSTIFSLLLLLLHFLSAISSSSSSSSFSPADHYLINCGSTTTTDPNNREFLGDESQLSDAIHLSGCRKTSVINETPSSEEQQLSELYKSARIFTKTLKYAFKIKEKGFHLVRLHFQRFNSSKFDVSNAQFHVSAGGYLLLNDFSGLTMQKTEIKEFVLWVDSDKLVILFKPSGNSKFGFVNAIEVISAPKDLILDTAQKVDFNGVVQFNGVSKFGFETLFRVNVGGFKVTPFNDSLWRTWVTDDGFLDSNGNSEQVHFGGRIKYKNGGASREVAPDNVYNSARVVRGSGSGSGSGVANYSLIWSFPVVDGYKYLVRTHFCDIASAALDLLYFNVRVNDHLSVENLDLSTITTSLASPYYADFVVNGGDGVITVSIGPSNWSSPSGVDALLNGIEVFKMSNSVDSFDGMVSPKSVMRRCRGVNVSFVAPLFAAVALLVTASLVLRKRLMGARDSFGWSRLPMDVSEVSMKSTYQ